MYYIGFRQQLGSNRRYYCMGTKIFVLLGSQLKSLYFIFTSPHCEPRPVLFTWRRTSTRPPLPRVPLHTLPYTLSPSTKIQFIKSDLKSRETGGLSTSSKPLKQWVLEVVQEGHAFPKGLSSSSLFHPTSLYTSVLSYRQTHVVYSVRDGVRSPWSV